MEPWWSLGGALVEPWGGLGVALGWLCTPESMPSIWPCGGLVVALGGFARACCILPFAGEMRAWCTAWKELTERSGTEIFLSSIFLSAFPILACIFHTLIETPTVRRVRARGLQERASVVGRVPSRGVCGCEIFRLRPLFPHLQYAWLSSVAA